MPNGDPARGLCTALLHLLKLLFNGTKETPTWTQRKDEWT